MLNLIVMQTTDEVGKMDEEAPANSGLQGSGTRLIDLALSRSFFFYLELVVSKLPRLPNT